MKTDVNTNLVGKQAQITMGCEVNEQTRACFADAPRPTPHFGAKCEIVAVYKQEGELMATVRISGFADTQHGGKLVEVFVTHLRLMD
jgi:hypothetical protein